MDSDPGCVVNLLIRESSVSLLPSGGLSEVVSHSDSEDVATRCVLKSCNLSKRPGRAYGHIPSFVPSPPSPEGGRFPLLGRNSVRATLTARYHPHGSPGVDDSLLSCEQAAVTPALSVS